MKVFVTGVAGQLGHDVMNELNKRGYEGIGSDIAPEYSGVQDGSAVTTMPYVSLDITDKEAVEKVLTEQKPDVVVHCAAWTAVDLAEDDDKVEKVRAINAGGTENIAKVCKKLDGVLNITQIWEVFFVPIVSMLIIIIFTYFLLGKQYISRIYKRYKVIRIDNKYYLGTFQISDLTYNTLGGAIGGVIYYLGYCRKGKRKNKIRNRG